MLVVRPWLLSVLVSLHLGVLPGWMVDFEGGVGKMVLFVLAAWVRERCDAEWFGRRSVAPGLRWVRVAGAGVC